ncbi:TetR/AcrR family transcriptional regulator [Paenibacillus sp. alder61]|uniref:TetR/AcrR family transcriptional regulator n=1 Tax=Paenibacillus faecis TaxID=862114 RepID=A0A5D0CJS8_9BACL|nr:MULTISPECIES: TetR/AcrR family transcriptional regulator [Paenibacillus]MCA1295265.1 TetR/AcrR family transcriptional regulator [Paenibacillus sp. alder61]TYA10148.1 TetR/AcrR family transcriptional regulator [Paenibacillus faecis]
MSNRRQTLLDAALALFIEHGYSDTTIQMILDQSGVSKGTFYKYFDSKEACIAAIFEQRLREDLVLLSNLEKRDYASEFDLLVDQLAIPMTLSDKQRVLELFWTGFYSGEFDSTSLIRTQLQWLAERLTGLFGDEIRPYATEGAMLCYGMLHQIANISRGFQDQQPNWKEVVPRVLSYIEAIMNIMHEQNEHILNIQVLVQFSSGGNDSAIDKAALVQELRKFDSTIQASEESVRTKEITQGLFMLLQEERLNKSLIEVVLKEFRKRFEATPFRPVARRIEDKIWRYMGETGDSTESDIVTKIYE